MTDAANWLSERIESAPAGLRVRMLAALERADPSKSVADQLAAAASECLQKALQAPARRSSALDLLTADALFTHALQAAAEAGGDSLTTVASAWNAARFEQLLTPREP